MGSFRQKYQARLPALCISVALVLGLWSVRASRTTGAPLPGLPHNDRVYSSPLLGPSDNDQTPSEREQPASSASGWVEFSVNPSGPHISETQRQRIETEIRDNIRRLGLDRDASLLLEPDQVDLSWPLQAASGLGDFGYHAVSAFVDHDAAFPNHLLDYQCGSRTYDTTGGYNHRGTDFFTWPFSWFKMDHDQVRVIAAAGGVIVYRQDGQYDRNCSFGSGDANAIVIQHSDGSRALYAHFKNGSLTLKTVGQTVTQGEYLGIIGSSGFSTGPHLHFELTDAQGTLVDPYQGACNSLPSSWWDQQRPYYDSAVNKLTTGSALPVFPECPQTEISNARTWFLPGERIYFITYYRDQRAVLPSQHTIYRPDRSVFTSWTGSISADHYAASYGYHYFTFAPSVMTGAWQYEVVFNGQTYAHDFAIVELTHHLYLPTAIR